jgi:uracil-DNA glycosylase family 4
MNEQEISQAGSLVEIEKMVAKCERCDLFRTKTKDVPGVGSQNAEVMFIGEGPGKDEDLQGEPFVGAAGKFLTEMIGLVGWARKDVYITNVVKHRPPNNRDPLPEEVEACWPYLQRQIELIQPKLIVFLGRHAMNRFFPEMKISQAHGKAFRKDFAGKKQVFLALYHPAAALYNGSMRQVLMDDFAKIPKILKKIEEETNNNNNSNSKQERLF